MNDLVEAKLRASDATSALLTSASASSVPEGGGAGGRGAHLSRAAQSRFQRRGHLADRGAARRHQRPDRDGARRSLRQERCVQSGPVAAAGRPSGRHFADRRLAIDHPAALAAGRIRRSSAPRLPALPPKAPQAHRGGEPVRDLDQKVNEEATRIASALANDVAVARAQLGSLQREASAPRSIRPRDRT